ncbi:hypothetical protein CRE_08835 [Caenorhabditis remanei]|uniref:Serpentine Receptor, class H n=1 Tax=Caenorhabditis remanei TaxID=31234 RepID=E3LHS6_CAERE|nr:hypothetical protein CRE_08835 [Caenorhabditis remanei]
MIDCSRHYLGSPDFLKISFHVVTVIAAPIHTFGFYCILQKTPKHMKTVKWLLFNLHCWCVLLDITVSLFGIPYILFPAPAGYQLGIIDAPRLIFYLGVTFVTGETNYYCVSTSIFVIFENRYFLLFGQNTRWRFVRKYILIGSYCLVPLYFVPSQLSIPEQENVEKFVWQSLSCIPEIPKYDRDLFLVADNIVLLTASLAIACGVPFIECATFFFLNAYHLVLARKPGKLSNKTIQMQYKLLLALFAQSSVTVIFFLIPVISIIVIIFTGYQSQVFNNIIILALAIHGIESTLIMVVAHKPYRKFMFLPFYGKRKKTATTVVSIIPSLRLVGDA